MKNPQSKSWLSFISGKNFKIVKCAFDIHFLQLFFKNPFLPKTLEWHLYIPFHHYILRFTAGSKAYCLCSWCFTFEEDILNEIISLENIDVHKSTVLNCWLLFLATGRSFWEWIFLNENFKISNIYSCVKYTEEFYTAAAAVPKSLQSCPTLCDPHRRSPSGSSVPGIHQARILEWVAISWSNACMHAKLLQSCPTPLQSVGLKRVRPDWAHTH